MVQIIISAQWRFWKFFFISRLPEYTQLPFYSKSIETFSLYSLVKIYLEFQWYPAGIPGCTWPDLSGIPGGFQVESAAIRWNYCRHSPGFPPEFQTTPTGILPELLPAFPRYSTGNPGWNSARIIAGIPPLFHRNSALEFRRNYCWYSSGIPLDFRAGIPPELLPAFPPVFHRKWGLEFCRNYCRHSPGIPPEFCRNYCQHSPGIPPEFQVESPLELLLAFSWYSTGILG